MRAQLAHPDLTPKVVAHPIPAASPASTDSPAAGPGVSQPCALWTDLPDDLAVQLMYWLVRASGSAALALTSQRFLQAGQAFRGSPWYQDARSVRVHERGVDWIRTYLGGLACNPRTLKATDISELKNTLRLLNHAGDALCMSLVIDGKPPRAVSGMDWLEGFRCYEGKTLRLSTCRHKLADDMIIQIARALPPEVCLSLDVYLHTDGILGTLEGMARLISCIAQTGRIMALELQWAVDLSVLSAELGAVLDIACGPGVISRLCFGELHNPDTMLRALSDRCSRFRHLKLVMFECAQLPFHEDLVALAGALEERQADGQSRLTVVVGCGKRFAADGSKAPLISADERIAFENTGLYLEYLFGSQPDHPAVQKVMRSVGKGPVDALLPRACETAEDASSDSDVIVASSDTDDAADWSAADADIEPDRSPDVQPPADDAIRLSDITEPRWRKRKYCVIS